MVGPDANPALGVITFSLDSYLVVITPTAFAVEPSIGGSSHIYCEITFSDPSCSGKAYDVFSPQCFRNLKVALAQLMKGESATVAFCGFEGYFALAGSWNLEHRVAAFKVRMGQSVDMDTWCEWRKIPWHGKMNTYLELTFCLEPAALEEAYVGVEAILDHVRSLRRRFPDMEENRDIDDEDHGRDL